MPDMAYIAVIKGCRNSAARRFAEGGGKFPDLNEDRARARLQALDAMHALNEIVPLRSVGLHRLRGDRKGQWAMAINGPWRLVFTFKAGDAYDVEIVDYH